MTSGALPVRVVLSNGPGASSRVRVRVGDQRVVRVVGVRVVGVWRMAVRVVLVWYIRISGSAWIFGAWLKKC